MPAEFDLDGIASPLEDEEKKPAGGDDLSRVEIRARIEIRRERFRVPLSGPYRNFPVRMPGLREPKTGPTAGS